MTNTLPVWVQGYHNTATVITAVIAFLLTSVSGFFFIPYLKRLKSLQTIKEIGPTWHKPKQGTPTMGGLMFMIGILASLIVGGAIVYLSDTVREQLVYQPQLVRLFAGIAMATAFGIMGYSDDYIKVVKKRNLGLRARDKLLAQLLISVAYLAVLQFAGVISTIVEVPFFGQWQLGWLYYPLMVCLIVGFVNAVNLTDGVDGLASTVTFVCALGFLFYSMKLMQPYTGLLAVAVAAGCLGFLVWNVHPAKIFMGDTGSMFLGGCVVALAFCLDYPLLLILSGIIYLGEALSVILQVISFRFTGKRIFKMSPIHHHFEMIGWGENKIVTVFSLITAVFCIIGYVALPL